MKYLKEWIESTLYWSNLIICYECLFKCLWSIKKEWIKSGCKQITTFCIATYIDLTFLVVPSSTTPFSKGMHITVWTYSKLSIKHNEDECTIVHIGNSWGRNLTCLYMSALVKNPTPEGQAICNDTIKMLENKVRKYATYVIICIY